MRKAKKLLTSLLAIALVLSNLSFGTLTVNATEGNEPIVEEQSGTGSVSGNEPSVSQNGPVQENPIMTTSLEGEELEQEIEEEPDGGNANEVILNFNQLGTPFGYGYTVTDVDDNGVATIAFDNGGGTHGEVRYNLPEDFDTSHVTKAELVLEDGSGVFIKLFLLENAGGYEKDQYGGAADCMYEYGNASATPSYQFKSIGICSPADVNEVKISGIKFTYGDVNLSVKEAPVVEPETPEVPADGTYAMSDLTFDATGDVTVVEAEDGSATLTFKGNWKTLFIAIPNALNDYAIDKVTFNVTSDNAGSFGFKTFTATQYTEDRYTSQTDVSYGNAVITPAADTKAELTYLAITSNFAGEASEDEIQMTISGITFEYSEVEGETPEASVGNYTITDLTLVETGDVTVAEAEDGSATLTFKGNWKTLFIQIPEALSGKSIDKITFNVTSDNAGSFGFKTFTAEQYKTDPWSSQTDVSYGNPTMMPAGDTKTDLTYLAITSNFASAASEDEIQMTISGISFEYSEAVADDVEKNEVIYNFKDLENVKSYGVTLTVSDGGELKAVYNADYQETFYKLPDALDPAKVKKVELLLTDGGSVTIKLYPNADGSGDAQVNYSAAISPSVEFLSFGIMNLGGADNAVKVSGVKFIVADTIDNLEINKTYTFNELTEAKNGGVAKSVDSTTGAVTLGYSSNYQEVFFNIPKEIDTSKVHKVTFNTTSETSGQTAYKFYTEEGFGGDWPSTNKVSYGNTTVTENSNNFDEFDDTRYFGIMSCVNFAEGETWSAANNYSITIDSVTFHTTGWGYSEGVEEDPNVTYGDNIIKNPNFAEEDLSMWTMGTSKSEIKSATAEKAVFDEVSTYGIIDRDASWSIPATEEAKEQDARHEFFAQDITAAIAEGGDLNRRPEYKVEFYAMLSDDYEGADAEQRVVEFAPYIITEQGDHEYLGVSYSSQLSGNLSQTLEAGKWTKFSGTFTVSHSGSIKQVVIRVVEQGTKYGDIAGGAQCVKGDYYITGVSMTEVFKPETTIETDIPNWKDAITDAFGDDAIAGTCLGSGTITYEYLQELAKKHFNAITFENEQKPDITLGSTPNIGADGFPILNFKTADSLMAQIKEWNDADPNDDINFKIRGHVLVWHSQTPEWFFHEDYDTSKGYVTPEVMNARMEHYIKSVFEHYKSVTFADGSTAADMFYGWDVVNEAMSDSTGKPRKVSDNSSWAAVYGDESNEYIINAFRYANKYAPDHIELYYNDYNDSNEPKASGIAALLAEITSHENDATYPTRIDGVGMQAHHNFADPTVGQIRSAINKYLTALEDGTVQMTELDVKKSSTFDGTAATLETEHNKQAWRFKEIFDVYREIEDAKPGSVGGITMWGITDETSWLQSNNSVGGASSGGAQAPLLFYIKDYVATAKPAFYAFFDEYESTLAPMIQDVTVMQQMETDNFDIGRTYGVDGVFNFVPMWTNGGLVLKVSVTDDSDDGVNDKITVYVDEAGSKSEGRYAKATVARNDASVIATESGYEAVITIPMTTGSAKTFGFDIAVDNNGSVSVFNDKKLTQDTTSEYYAEAIMKPYATVQSGTVTVDAKADAVWSNVAAIPLTINLGSKVEASVKVLWDATCLYVYADVKDSVLNNDSADDYQQDSLEVFIDENNNKSDSYEADDKQYRVSCANKQSFNGTKCVTENISSATKTTSTGYVVEAAYKWTDITPAEGMEIGLEFQINDADASGSRIGTLSWYDTSGQGWSSPGVFGTVKLVGAATVPSIPSTGGDSSSDSGFSSGSSSSGSSSTTTPEETPVEPPVEETTTTPEVGGSTGDDTPAEDITPTIPTVETIIPKAVETVVEQVKVLVDANATMEEKVEAVQEVIDTVVEVIANEEVQELAKEAISSIEETIKAALGIETKVESEGEDVPEVKSVIGALLSVDAGKQPTLAVEALAKDSTPELDKLEEGLTNAFPLNIKLFADDEEVQPNVPITIRMEIPKGIERDKDIKVVHFGKSGKSMLDVTLFDEEMEFTTDGFSTFVVVNVESATVGTEIIPADYNTEEVADSDGTTSSAIEEASEDSGVTTFIIIVIALLAVVAAGFFMWKNKREE